jgi:hypothetical protein
VEEMKKNPLLEGRTKSSREKEKDDTLDPNFDARSSGVSKMHSRKAGQQEVIS